MEDIMELFIKQRIFSFGDKYDILDENGNVIFYVQSKVFSFGAKIFLYDNNGNEHYFL